jgi:hypothetical protein
MLLAADIDALGCWLLVIPTSLLTDLSGVGAAGHVGTGGSFAWFFNAICSYIVALARQEPI